MTDSIQKQASKLGRKVAKITKLAFAPYVVMDDYGTVQCEWTLVGAASWIRFCSHDMLIWNRWSGKMVAARKQS